LQCVDSNAESIDLEGQDEEEVVEEIPRPMGNRMAKMLARQETADVAKVSKDMVMQLDINRSCAITQLGKAEAAQTQARTTRDKFLFKLVAFNPESQVAKEWVQMKIKEAMEEAAAAKAEKRKQEIEMELALLKVEKKKVKLIKQAVAPAAGADALLTPGSEND
jgi:hypothetical protein